MDKVVVATDDKRIFEHVLSFKGEVMYTSDSHESGTQRCGEVLVKLEDRGEDYDVIINIQGDEPFIHPDQIRHVVRVFEEDGGAEIATLAKRIDKNEDLFSEHVMKVTLTDEEDGEIARDALYFSRSPIPFYRGADKEEWLNKAQYYKHIGVYAFNVEEFHEILQLEISPLEQSEVLEQLRWITNHYTIQVVETDHETIGIDTPEDLEKLKNLP